MAHSKRRIGMKTIFKVLFIISGLGMIWWVFFWPGVMFTEKDQIITRIGMTGTFALLVVSAIVLVVLRIKKGQS